MPGEREKGLYWARVGDEWYIVNYLAEKVGFGIDEFARMTAVGRRRHDSNRIAMGTVGLEEIDEWAARITEPGEG